MTFRAAAIAGLVPLLGLAGCGEERRPPWKASGPKGPPTAEARYLPPPDVVQAIPGAGGVLLSGTAAPDAQIMLGTPDGRTLGANANDEGRWTVEAPSPRGVALYGLFMQVGDRKVNAEGYLVLTEDGRAAQLRAGAGTRVLGQSSRPPRILAIDFDRDGGAVVSGVGTPKADVGLRVNRAAGGTSAVDDRGRFAIALVRPLGTGLHEFEVAGEGGEDVVSLATDRPAPLGEAVYRAVTIDGGWRIDWRTPTGGVQSTLLLDPDA